MPITEKQKDQLKEILASITEPAELMKLTEAVYDTILAAKMDSKPLMSLGKLIYARTPWRDLPNEWAKLGGNPAGLNQFIRLPLIRACEEFLIPKLAEIFTIVPEAAPEPEPDLSADMGEPVSTPEAAAAPAEEAPPPEKKENGHSSKKAKGDKADANAKAEVKAEPPVSPPVETA